MKISELVRYLERIREDEGDVDVVFGPQCRPLRLCDIVDLDSKRLVKRIHGPSPNAILPDFKSPVSNRVSRNADSDHVRWQSTSGEPVK